ncbi:MAG: bifunctional oligoribonuclease/PAP phosphatase NrnA [Candidatus Aureabacteria bacterium]|nr:bifunctional oligoribonuclease/PAP phosphatase NrnA [Candidatus Auribacterota bacterium]
MASLARVKKIIRDGKVFALTTHIYPDGDAIGSTMAYLLLLKSMNKSAVAIIPSPAPLIYRFLDRRGDLLAYHKKYDPLIAGADALFILDSSTNDRLGPIYEVARRSGVRRVCIDHHPGNTVEAETKFVKIDACSTAQLIYELYLACGREIGRDAAIALYTGMHTDTVSFNFLGTTARTHEIVADLLRRGVDPKEAWLRMYGNDSPRLMKLAGITLEGLRTAAGGRIAWVVIRESQWRLLRVNPSETESITRYPLTLRGVGVIALFCEEGRRQVRVSMRALDRTDVGKIARALGGGGHSTSAGVRMQEPLPKVVRKIIKALMRRKP